MGKDNEVGIWILHLTKNQTQSEGPDQQKARAQQYARSKGWFVKEVYYLGITTSKEVRDHTETSRMLQHVKSGHITGLILPKLGSLARNTNELLEFTKYFKDYNADMISLHESIDTSTPAGKLFFTMVTVLAQWEREEVSNRVTASVPMRAKLGKSTGGQASFGYQWKNKKLVPNKKEAPVRRLIYELFLEHKRKKTVARILNEQGYRTRKGAKFSDTTITRLLRDPTAKGMRRANYTKSREDSKQWELKPKDDWIFIDVEPIVSEELWNRCNQILDEIQKSTKKPVRKDVKLFTGIAYCHCGSKMYVPSNSPKYICKECRNKIPENDLEYIFQEKLKDMIYSSDPVELLMNNEERQIKEKEELLQTLNDDHKITKKKVDKLFQLHVDGEISEKGFGRRYKPLEERLQQIEKQIPEIQGELDYVRISNLSRKQIIDDSKELYSKWSKFTEEERRKIIETITEKIIIDENEIRITLKHHTSF